MAATRPTTLCSRSHALTQPLVHTHLPGQRHPQPRLCRRQRRRRRARPQRSCGAARQVVGQRRHPAPHQAACAHAGREHRKRRSHLPSLPCSLTSSCPSVPHGAASRPCASPASGASPRRFLGSCDPCSLSLVRQCVRGATSRAKAANATGRRRAARPAQPHALPLPHAVSGRAGRMQRPAGLTRGGFRAWARSGALATAHKA
jgi:hypothetical protein